MRKHNVIVNDCCESRIIVIWSAIQMKNVDDAMDMVDE